MTIAIHRFKIFLQVVFPVGLAIFLCIGCQDSPSLGVRQETSSPASDIGLEEIPNFSKVCNGLYRGGQPTDAGYNVLKGMGVRSIVTLRVLDHSPEELQEASFRVYHISVKHIHPEAEDVLEFLKIATNPENQPVFVHCREGVDRTGMMISLYRMVVQDWPRAKAIHEMKQRGFNDWNLPIERFLLHVNTRELRQELADHVKQPRDRKKI